MPPKSASTTAGPPRRSARNIARNSIPSSNCSTPIISAPPSAAVIPEPLLKEIQVVDLSNTKDAPQTFSNSTIALYQSQSPNVEKTLGTDSGPVKPDIGRTTVNDGDESGVEKLGPEKTICVEGETVAAGSGNGKRKIVRKTVRIVKKVIKKRVPKRCLKNGSENQGVVGKVENSVDLDKVKESLGIENIMNEKPNVVHDLQEKATSDDELREISKLSDQVIENSKLVDDVIRKPDIIEAVTDKCSPVNDVMDESNIVEQKTSSLNEVIGQSNVVDDARDTSKHDDNDVFVSEPIAREKSNDLSDIDSVVESKVAKSKTNQDVLGPINDGTGHYQHDIYSVEAHVMNSNDVITGADMKDINVHVPDLKEDEKVNFTAESNQISQEVDFVMESESKEPVLVNQNEEEAGLVTEQNVGPVEENSVVLVEEKNGSDHSDLEKHSVGLNKGLLLSGEMEALERKKRRKIDVFVGGLDKDTKEEDIWKVFEKVGVVVEVNLKMNSKTGKNKGFAFVKFATASDAKNAFTKYPKIEICGKQCDVSPVEGNDTLFLGNIDRKWKTEDVMQLLEKCGIDKIDKVTLKADPNKIDKNRGFAFVELETSKVAQIAFNKLQKSIFVKNMRIRVAWAQPLIEPAEEEILKVRSVYAEYLPSSWDEEQVKEYFKRFGEIENVTLAKDLPSSRRKDFAFINYMTREAALACIESINSKKLDDDNSKVKMTVSLAKPFSKIKPIIKHAPDLITKQLPKEKPKSSYATIKLHEPRHMEKPAINSYDHAKFYASPSDTSTTNELVQILRQQASNNHIPPRQSIGSSIPDNHFPQSGIKRPFSLVGHDPLYLEPRGLPRGRFESSYPISSSSALSHGGITESRPYHHQQQHQHPPHPGLPSESVNGRNIYPSHLQTREQAPYYGNNSIYRRY